MASFDSIVKMVANVVPPMNDFALRGFIKQNIDNAPEFIALVFREGFKLIPADIELMGYEFMSPEDTVKFELKASPDKSRKAKIPLTVTHMNLVRYRVRFNNDYHYAYIYTPYMHEDMIYVKGKRSMIRKVILEQTFSRVVEKTKDGISVSPIRVNLTFNRRSTFRIESYITKQAYTKFIVGARLFHGDVVDTTIVHYMLAKFGFLKTLSKFGFTKNDISFTTTATDDLDKYDYFAAKKFEAGEEPDLFLKVKKTLLGDDQSLKFIVNLIYVLYGFKDQTIDNVYVNEGSIWKVILGIIVLKEKAAQRAYTNAESHLRSVDHFIDPLTRDRLRTFGVVIDDIYDLLVHIFSTIDHFMVNNQVQDLYSQRLDVANGILVKSYAEKIYKNIYALAKKSNISFTDVKKMLRLSPMMFRQPSLSRSDDDKDYMGPPEIVGDNFLFSGGLNKIRMGGRPEQRYHPSVAVAESTNAFVGKTINRTGYINPFIPTDANGAILHPDYAVDSIDQIKKFLPK